MSGLKFGDWDVGAAFAQSFKNKPLGGFGSNIDWGTGPLQVMAHNGIRKNNEDTIKGMSNFAVDNGLKTKYNQSFSSSPATVAVNDTSPKVSTLSRDEPWTEVNNTPSVGTIVNDRYSTEQTAYSNMVDNNGLVSGMSPYSDYNGTTGDAGSTTVPPYVSNTTQGLAGSTLDSESIAALDHIEDLDKDQSVEKDGFWGSVGDVLSDKNLMQGIAMGTNSLVGLANAFTSWDTAKLYNKILKHNLQDMKDQKQRRDRNYSAMANYTAPTGS